VKILKAIVFIGSNKSGSSYEAIKASEKMLYYTVLLTNQKAFLDKNINFQYVHLVKYADIGDIEQIKKIIDSLILKGLGIHAIVGFTDPYCHTAALLACEYGLKCFSSEAIYLMLNKIESRKILDGSPYTPFFYTIKGNDKPEKKTVEKKLPLVLKIPDSTGSKDVYKVHTYNRYEATLSEIRKDYPDEPVLAEKYLEGPQYLVETVTVDGKVNIVAIVEQKITFTGRFIVTGYKIITDMENNYYRSLKEAAVSIIDRHGLKDGPCHLEIRYAENEWKLIEANPRISGGAMNLFIETAYGINLVKETLKFALGLTPDFRYQHVKETYLQYVIVPKEGILIKVTGKNRAINCPGIEHVYVRPKKGSIIYPPISMGFRYAYVIATGDTDNNAMENAKYGASQIKFYLREIDHETIEQLSDRQRKLISIAYENKEHINSVDTLFNNYILG